MEIYRCAYCGEVFDPVKSGVCPNSAESGNSLFSGWLYAGHHTQGRVYFQVPAEAARLIVVFDNGPQFSIDLS